MELLVKAPVLDLKAGQVVSLIDAEGARILGRCGTVWVTQEGSHEDHILGPGDELVVARAGRTVVQALQPSRIAIREVVDAANDPD